MRFKKEILDSVLKEALTDSRGLSLVLEVLIDIRDVLANKQ